MEYVVDPAAIEGLADILLEKFEARLMVEMSNILPLSGQ